MYISQENASKIVMELSEVINHSVNFMDEHGQIIASTDYERVGTFHEGAALLIANRMQELTVFRDDEFPGTRKGINLPLEYNGKIVGAIGVTGEYSEVVKFGRIIKKMAEVLILEYSRSEQRNLDERIQVRFLETWLFTKVPYAPQFVDWGKEIGVDVTQRRRALVLDLHHTQQSDAFSKELVQTEMKKVSSIMQNITEMEPGLLFMQNANSLICLVPDQEDEKILSLAKGMQARLEKKCALQILVGISDGGIDMRTAYAEAQQALTACNASSSQRILFFKDITIELFIDYIPADIKMEYIRRIFKDFEDKEIKNTIKMLDVYFSNNGSLEKTAEEIFTHKNTLQYRLRKIAERTGHDPRHMKDAALFICAINFARNIHQCRFRCTQCQNTTF